jgi:hypothetical protein
MNPSKIQNVLQEIEYYESIGMHKIADSLTSTLTKIGHLLVEARIFSPEDMPGGKLLIQKTVIDTLNKFIQTNPDCILCFQSATGLGMIQDKADLLAQYPNEPQKALDIWMGQVMSAEDGTSQTNQPCQKCFEAFNRFAPASKSKTTTQQIKTFV